MVAFVFTMCKYFLPKKQNVYNIFKTMIIIFSFENMVKHLFGQIYYENLLFSSPAAANHRPHVGTTL